MSRLESGDPDRLPAQSVLPGWNGAELLRQFLDSTSDCAVLLGLDARIVWANAAASKLLSLDHESGSDRTMLSSLRAEDRPVLSAALSTLIQQQAPEARTCEVRHCVADGAERTVLWTLHSSRDSAGNTIGFSGCGRDVTEQRRFEVERRRNDARVSAILASVLDPMVTIDEHGMILSASDSVERDFGYSPAELIGQNVRILMPEPHRSNHDGYLERHRRTRETGIIGRTREFEVVRKDGTRFWCAISVSRADPSDGQAAVFTGTFRDITELKRATQALVASEQRLHAIFDGSFQLIGLLSPSGLVLEMNRTALEAIGARREDILGVPFAETRWWSHSLELCERVRAAVEAAARGEFVRFEARSVAHDGSLRDIDFSLNPVKDASGRVVLLIPEGRDISELKRAQRAELAMLRAFAAIGESAALLAHEIKNPITAVHVALRAVASELGEDHREVLEDLVSRMQRIEQMMRRTLSFTRPLDLRCTSCTASQLFESVIKHLQDDIARSRTDVRVAVPTGDVDCVCDRQMLRDVIANLVTNAIEANGRDAVVLLTASRDADGSVVLAVEDEGPGIPESMIDSLFRPFVTTKESGNGLGLAICRKVVEEHGGTITADRGRSFGARFEIRLPADRKLS